MYFHIAFSDFTIYKNLKPINFSIHIFTLIYEPTTMRRFTILILTLLASSYSFCQTTAQSPSEYLGYELGSQFSRHYQVVNYFKHLNEKSDKVSISIYGETYEKRPLLSVIITDETNQENIEQIRKDNLIRAGMENGENQYDIPIVWLGYNVHGNESVSTEAAMKTAYELITNRVEWLKNVVIIIEPCINPDGRERYVNFYWQNGHRNYNPDPLSKEHREPWLSGRSNHYMFDLNRDWAWITQTESSSRVALYNQWLPHVAVDFHEQGVNSPYYFAPAAKPYHELLTNWQIQFQTEIGKNHAKYFDRQGWLYFTKEVFDLLYPSYGDTYPSFGGSIGMTYEQGGSGRAGLGVKTTLGDTLTLRDRIDHHFTTGISTVEMTYKNGQNLLSHFEKYFEYNSGDNKSYIIKNLSNSDLKYLSEWFELHRIKFGSAKLTKPTKAFSYKLNRQVSITVEDDDLIVPINQPKWRFVKSLFEQRTSITDSITYDVTAWSIPYAFGLEAYEMPIDISPIKPIEINTTTRSKTSQNSYAIFAEWEGVGSIKFLSELLQKGVKVRTNKVPFSNNGKSFERGTIIVTKRGNEHFGDRWITTVNDLANENDVPLYSASSGFADRGVDLGSGDIDIVDQPKVAMVTGAGTSTLAVGATWYYMEQIINYPFTALESDLISENTLKHYNVLILQNGSYRKWGEREMGAIDQWVKAGGKLILIQNALRKFIGRNGYSLRKYNDESEKSRYEELMKSVSISYANRERESMKKYISGAIFEGKMDNTHPLGFGYDTNYFTLKTNSQKIALLEDGWNVAKIERKSDLISGFAGKKALEFIPNSLVFGSESHGRGTVVYFVDDPMFRAMWRNGYRVFANALFYVD